MITASIPYARCADAQPNEPRGPRGKSRLACGLALAFAWMVAISFATAPAAAQEPDTVPPERPFVEGGVYDKPYLGTLFGRTAIGGYAEGHARFERVDGITEDLGFEARRFNLFTATRVSDFVRIGAELEIEEGGEEIKLEFAAMDVTLHPRVNLRGGMILLPLGRFNLAHDSPMNEFTDRPLVSTELLGVALSQPGIGLFGMVPLEQQGRITYEAYAVNGFDRGVLSGSGEGTRLPAGAWNVEDENASPGFVARTAWSPFDALELGVSGYLGAYNDFHGDGLDFDRRRNVTVGVVDLQVEVVGVRLEGEGALAGIDVPPGLGPLFAERQRGFYLQGVYDFGSGWLRAMPTSFFSTGVRVEAVDFDADAIGDSVQQVQTGLNFRATSDTVLKLDYVRGRAFDAFNNREDYAGVLFSLATYF